MSYINTLPNIFFTSDYHAFHKKILILGKGRPFENHEEMHAAIVDRHNAVVRPGDKVYNEGDFALSCTWEQAYAFRQRLLGEQHFIYGNHDKYPGGHVAEDMIMNVPDCFASVNDLVTLKLKDYGVPKITLSHYAMRTWPSSHKGAWQLYGHSHNMLPEEPQWLAFDVGVDCWDFTPVSIEQVAQKMKAKMPMWEKWRESLPEGRME